MLDKIKGSRALPGLLFTLASAAVRGGQRKYGPRAIRFFQRGATRRAGADPRLRRMRLRIIRRPARAPSHLQAHESGRRIDEFRQRRQGPHGRVPDNRLGTRFRPAVGDEPRPRRSSRVAGIADDIRKMPQGMQTLITEGSGGVSGGQRQRLLIARPEHAGAIGIEGPFWSCQLTDSKQSNSSSSYVIASNDIL